ncbi:MAG TPA: hypothetical protein VFR61_04435 [Nitrososphaeraceae archaeon]|jgi:hypothetical protein|nr:hypothetical protein [Nitrososphaeraceae archaeon]
MTSKPTIQKIKLSKEQQEQLDFINKGISMPVTKMAKNSMRNYEYKYTTKSRPISDIQKKVKLRELYGSFCCICQDIPAWKVIYQMEGAKRIENYCVKCYSRWLRND